MDSKRLLEIRTLLGLTQEELASKISLSRVMVGLMERGEKPVSKSTEILINHLLQNKDNNTNDNKVINEKNNVIQDDLQLHYKTGSESIDIESAGKDWIVTKSGMRYYEREDGLYHLETMLVPFEAHQAYLVDDVQQYGEWEKVTFIVDRIGRGRYLGWRTHGESMFNYQNPSFYDTPGNSLLLSRELGRHLWQDGFNSNKAPLGWVLVTKKNIVHKDIIKFDKVSGVITCHSRNPDPEYQDFELSLNDVNEIHKVIKRSM